MFIDIWNTLVYYPIFNLLIFFYKLCFENMALAIVGVTVFVKLVTYPLNQSSVELGKKQRELQPEIAKLKAKYKDKKVFAEKQMELYKEHGINPIGGCLPQIIMLVLVFGPLYRVFSNVLSNGNVMLETINSMTYNWEYLKFMPGAELNTSLFMMNLSQTNYIIPAFAAVAQFALTKLMTPAAQKMEKVAEDTPDIKDDIMYNMQGQMIYMFPILTFIIGIGLPSGLALYMFVSTVLTIFQYLLTNNLNYGQRNTSGKDPIDSK